MSQDNVHSEPGHQADDALGNRQGFAVRGGVGPRHGDSFPLQILQSAEMVDQMERIGHRLGRVVDIALEVDDGGPLRKDAFTVSLVDRGRHFLLISMAFTQVDVIADPDHFCEKRDHCGGFPNGFPMGYLRLLFIQILYRQPEQVAGTGKTKPCSGGFVSEYRDGQPRVENSG